MGADYTPLRCAAQSGPGAHVGHATLRATFSRSKAFHHEEHEGHEEKQPQTAELLARERMMAEMVPTASKSAAPVRT